MPFRVDPLLSVPHPWARGAEQEGQTSPVYAIGTPALVHCCEVLGSGPVGIIGLMKRLPRPKVPSLQPLPTDRLPRYRFKTGRTPSSGSTVRSMLEGRATL